MNDSHRLLLEWFDAIHNSPSQVYHLALPFYAFSVVAQPCFEPQDSSAWAGRDARRRLCD